jgi:hypothetical protein
VLVEEQGQTYVADSDGDSDEARTLRPLQAAACTYRIAFGPRAGQKVLTLQGAMPRDTDFKQSLCANIQGFSLHAAVRCGADDSQALEQLCRYTTRPALANERVQTKAAGQLVLKLKTPWRYGTTLLVMSPLEFMQRLAALEPRPRLPSRMTGTWRSILLTRCPVWVERDSSLRAEAVVDLATPLGVQSATSCAPGSVSF